MPRSLVVSALFLGSFLDSTSSRCEDPPLDGQLKHRLAALEKEIEDLRTLLKIPGIAAAVVKDQQLIWSKGFGLADREKQIPVTPDTPFRIASLTKTFTSTLLMQLVEQGILNLDEPMSKYSAEFKGDAVKVRHVFSHASEGPTPGTRYVKDAAGKVTELVIRQNARDVHVPRRPE